MNSSINECYICSASDNLIHMETNSLIIGSVYIDFAQLISEVLQIKMNDESAHSMICVSCKDQLSQFYVLKQQASKHLTPSDIRKSKIIDNVSSFLDSTPVDCIVSKYSSLLAIYPDSSSSTFAESLQRCASLLECEEVQEAFDELEDCNNMNFKAEDVDEVIVLTKMEHGDFIIDEVETEERKEHEFEESVVLNVKEELDTMKPPRRLPVERKRPKKYQKSKLDAKQREWVRKELKMRAVFFETPLGHKTQWVCKKCLNKSFSSENAFRIHLRQHLDASHENSIDDEQDERTDDTSFIEQKLWIMQQLQTQKEVVESSDGTKSFSWNCQDCEFSSNKRGRFRIHLQKVHTTIRMRGPNKHSCYDCRLRFDGENHLVVHRNCHRIFDVIAPHAQYPGCDSCAMFFATAEDLQIHSHRHQYEPDLLRDIIPAIGVVHRNGETFVSEDDDQVEVTDENAPTCGHCLVKFVTENECRLHLMLFHATYFTCPFDNRVFEGIPTLSFGNHLRQGHPDLFETYLEIACGFCKMQFETVYEKLAHMKKCKAKNFQCDHCARSFFRKADLLHHLKVVTGLTVFACHLCAKRCKDQGDLKTHIRSHTNQRPYQCPHCEKAYKTSSARASHVESHMEPSFSCDICNVKFRRRILYQRHMKTLHDEAFREKSFLENTCKICNKSWLRKTHFKNHMKSHELGKK